LKREKGKKKRCVRPNFTRPSHTPEKQKKEEKRLVQCTDESLFSFIPCFRGRGGGRKKDRGGGKRRKNALVIRGRLS